MPSDNDSPWKRARDAASRATTIARDAATEAAKEARFAATEAAKEARIAATGAAKEARAAVGEMREQWEVDRRTEELRATAQRTKEQAELVISRLKKVHEDPHDADAVLTTFVDLLSPTVAIVDRHSDAISLAYMNAAGIGVHVLTGLEITYVRGPNPILRVAAISGRAVRLAFEASAAAYVACTYGDRALLQHPIRRRGADAQIVIANGSLFVSTFPDAPGRTAGWLGGFNAGLGVAVPFLSDLAVYETTETQLSRHELSDRDAARVEAVLRDAGDRKRLRQLSLKLVSET